MPRDRVDEYGFAIAFEVIAPGEIARLLGELEATAVPRRRAGIRHAMRHPGIANIARSEALLALAEETLGRGALPFRATLFEKSPAANWLVAWHQDTALPLGGRRDTPGWGPWSVKEGLTYAHAPAEALSKVLALRLHLDDSTAENGPLRVLPGTHRQGVLSDAEMHALASRVAAVECTVPRGGVLAMRPLLVHASSKSTAALPRRVLHIEYAAKMRVGDGLELAMA